MARVRFNVNSGANIHSNNQSEWMDTVNDLGLDLGEWEGLSGEEKWGHTNEWAQNYLEIFYEEDPSPPTEVK